MFFRRRNKMRSVLLTSVLAGGTFAATAVYFFDVRIGEVLNVLGASVLFLGVLVLLSIVVVAIFQLLRHLLKR